MENARTRREREVWRVCDELWAQHASLGAVTGDAIRDRLVVLGYKKGSPNEIYKYRHTWKLSRHISENQEEAEEQVLQDPISRAVALVQEELKAQAKTELQAQIKIFEHKQEQLEAEKICVQEELDALREKHAGLMQDKQSLDQKYQAMQDELHHLRKDYHVLENSLTKTQTLLDDSYVRLEDAQKQHSRFAVETQKTHEKELERLKFAFEEKYLPMVRSLEQKNKDLEKELKKQGGLSMAESHALKIEIRNKDVELGKLEKSLSHTQASFEKSENHYQQQVKQQEILLKTHNRIIDAFEKAKDEARNLEREKHEVEIKTLKDEFALLLEQLKSKIDMKEQQEKPQDAA